MESLITEEDFVVLSLLKKRKRKCKYWVHLILRLRREEGEGVPPPYQEVAGLSRQSDSKFTSGCQ